MLWVQEGEAQLGQRRGMIGYFLLRLGDGFGSGEPWAYLGVLCFGSCSAAYGSPRGLRKSWDPPLYTLGSRAKSQNPGCPPSVP